MLKVLELFAGIGACSSALTRLGIEYEIIDAVEIDRFAIKSFNAIHGTNFEPQDITSWDKNIDADLIMHGSPCQDFSVAGKQAGGDINSGTRSSLMYETIRIVGKLRPKYVVWENVKNLLSVKHKHNFDDYLNTMKSLGYTSYYQVLNAKDYGSPQNRERVFTVSIRNDVDKGFVFPYKQELQIRLKDILENNVEEKYFLKNAQLERMKKTNYESSKFENRVRNENGIAPTLCARDYKDPKCVQIGTLDMKGIEQIKRVYSPKGLSPTLTTMGGGNTEPKIIMHDDSKIRKLTPRECWRLMGFTDEEFEKACYGKEIVYIEGDLKCNAKLKIVKEKQRHTDMETYVLCTTKDMSDTEIQKLTLTKNSILKELNENSLNVNIAIEMLGEQELKECATSIIKCTDYTEMQNTLIKELDRHHMAIIELGKEGKQNTEKYMKIILGENCDQVKLYIISTLIEQIIKSKIYTYIHQQANIQGNIAILEDCRNNLNIMRLLNLKMEYITQKMSNSSLYKQARKFHCCKCISGNI